MGSTVFRSAKYTSHEVTIDDEQVRWFEQLLIDHPSKDGWRVFVFTHAPPNGSGLRVLQENHVVNGCCWLNHSDEEKCSKFINLVREHRCVKAWFSGHFHLGQDYQDSITFPTIDPKDGPYPNRGSCVFVQTSVMRKGTSRDGRQQSRLIRGDEKGFEICTVDHQKDGAIRVDATIKYTDCNHEIGVYAHKDETLAGDKYFKVYQPCAGDSLHPPDDGYIPYGKDGLLHVDEEVTKETVAWWAMANGRTMGMLNGMLVEYDSSTLAPLGLIVGADELVGKRIAVIDSGEIENCLIPADGAVGMEGAECAVSAGVMREQAVVMYDMKTKQVTVVQPNEDGSYWRKIVRNKMIRMKEKRRVQAAQAYSEEVFEDVEEPRVVSSWGPYTSMVGTATATGVAGLTAKSKLTEKELEKAAVRAEAAENWQKLNSAEALSTGWASSGSELAKAFGELDTEGTGSLGVKDLALAIKAAQPGIEDDKVAAMVALIDEDGDGSVTLQEFVMLMLFQAPPAKVLA